MIVTIVAILVVAISAAYLRDRLDARSAKRTALHDALERGEIDAEDYARAIQSAA